MWGDALSKPISSKTISRKASKFCKNAGVIRNALRSFVVLGIPLTLSFFNVACMGGGGPATGDIGSPVAEINPTISTSEVPFPVAGPANAANSPSGSSVPGTQSTDSGTPSGLIAWLFLHGEVIPPSATGEDPCQTLNDSLKIIRWSLVQGTWQEVQEIPITGCGKFSLTGVSVAVTEEERPFVKFTASMELHGQNLAGTFEMPGLKNYEAWDKHVTIRLRSPMSMPNAALNSDALRNHSLEISSFSMLEKEEGQ